MEEQAQASVSAAEGAQGPGETRGAAFSFERQERSGHNTALPPRGHVIIACYPELQFLHL